ncbi:acyl-CoA thioester hydrolase [Melghirimyces profundicolus]|uniref:Acyl-CoA thioester hydrolase n=1 Tax=Melghirimyces profundicolus TaxID=1242148 RepID=A0A2T6C8K7_9BACL|nr:thioesterase family protein [Melghirimyces profundicolus]PTX64629.1 acyl-CoA thioester hydrolase [Melghirimyces profundicolus]
MKNVFSYKVAWGDADAAGIVFYPHFYRWMDQATHELFDVAGLPTVKLFKDERVGLPILEAHCRFEKPVFFGTVIDIESTLLELHRKVFKIRHRFKTGDTLNATGYEVRAWTVFSGDRPKAVPIPEEVRALFQGE